MDLERKAVAHAPALAGVQGPILNRHPAGLSEAAGAKGCNDSVKVGAGATLLRCSIFCSCNKLQHLACLCVCLRVRAETLAGDRFLFWTQCAHVYACAVNSDLDACKLAISS